MESIMEELKNTCNACFAAGEAAHCQPFDSGFSALAEYTALHQGGLSAFMCMQDDQQYRVCIPLKQHPTALLRAA